MPWRMIMPALVLAMLPTTAPGQQPVAKSQWEADHQAVEAERQAIVAANLPLTGTEAEAFWPVYRDYRERMGELEGQGFELVMEYAGLYNTGQVTDADGKRLMEQALDNDAKRLQARQDVWKEVSRVLPGAKAARYMQIENKLDALRRAEFTREIPLVEP